MSEQLKKANEKFKDLLKKLQDKKEIDKDTEAILYFFFMAGWDGGFKEGSGMVQMVQ